MSLALIAQEQGDVRCAEALYAEGLALVSSPGGEVADMALGLEGLAEVAAALGYAERAARLCGAVEALRATHGIARRPANQARYDRAVATARTALGEEVFAAAWAAGQALSVDDAVAEALASTV
jgi:hypothetical protein